MRKPNADALTTTLLKMVIFVLVVLIMMRLVANHLPRCPSDQHQSISLGSVLLAGCK